MAPSIGVHESVEIMFPPAVLVEELDARGVDVELVRRGESLGGLAGVVTFQNDGTFFEAEELQWVHSTQAGVNRIPINELADTGIIVTSSNGIHGYTAGETVAGYMLMFARCLHRHVRSQLEHEWDAPAWDVPFSLTGERVCVVGLGTLGEGVARVADGIGMHVTGVRRTPLPVGHVETVHTTDELIEAIEPARFVVLAVPLTDETERLIGERELAAMRDDAYLINIARGSVVDEPAMIDALETDEIAGAAIDVAETEPLPPDSPLWDFEDVIITPHEATDHRDKHRDIAKLVRENARRLGAGESLVNRLA